MKKLIILLHSLVLLSSIALGQAKITPDSTGGTNMQPVPSIQWSRNSRDGKAIYYIYDAKTGKTYPIYTAQFANYVFLSKDEAANLYQPKSTTITETDPTVPAYAKTISSFAVIKQATDPLYLPLHGVADNSAYLNGYNAVYLLNRANQTGTQAQSTVTKLPDSLANKYSKSDANNRFLGKHATADNSALLGGNAPGFYTTAANITTDATHRFVSDSQISTWNAKQNALVYDNVPTSGSSNIVNSDAVYKYFQNYQIAGNYIQALTGDGTATGPGTASFSLTTVNTSPGTYGNASSALTIIVDGKGRAIGVTAAPIQIAESQVTNLGTDLSSKVPYTGANASVNLGSYSLTSAGTLIQSWLGGSSYSSISPIDATPSSTNYAFRYRNGNTIINAGAGGTTGLINFNINDTYAASINTNGLQVAGSITQGSVTASILKADGSGKIVAAVAGTDYNSVTSVAGKVGAVVLTASDIASLTGYISGAGSVSGTDNVLQAIQKINGNQAADAANFINYYTKTQSDANYIYASPATPQVKNISIDGTATIRKNASLTSRIDNILLAFPTAEADATPTGNRVGNFAIRLDQNYVNPDGIKDDVMTIGFNHDGYGDRVNTNAASLNISFESHYLGTLGYQQEMHFEHQALDGVSRRFMSFLIRESNGYAQQLGYISDWLFQTAATSTQWFRASSNETNGKFTFQLNSASTTNNTGIVFNSDGGSTTSVFVQPSGATNPILQFGNWQALQIIANGSNANGAIDIRTPAGSPNQIFFRNANRGGNLSGYISAPDAGGITLGNTRPSEDVVLSGYLGNLTVSGTSGTGVTTNLKFTALQIISNGSISGTTGTFTGAVSTGALTAANTTLTKLYIQSTDQTTDRGIKIEQFDNSAIGANFTGNKYRGTVATPLAVNNGDLGQSFITSFYDGTALVNPGYATFLVNGTVATGSIPTDFVIYLGTSGTNQPERFRISGSTGNQTNTGTITAPTFIGALTGHASLDLTIANPAFTGILTGPNAALTGLLKSSKTYLGTAGTDSIVVHKSTGEYATISPNAFLNSSTAASTYVPYTGATADVNLATRNLTAALGTFNNSLNVNSPSILSFGALSLINNNTATSTNNVANSPYLKIGGNGYNGGTPYTSYFQFGATMTSNAASSTLFLQSFVNGAATSGLISFDNAGGMYASGGGAFGGPLQVASLVVPDASSHLLSIVPQTMAANATVTLWKTTGYAALISDISAATENKIAKAAAYTITTADFATGKAPTLTIFVDATSGAFTLTFPTGSSWIGYIINVIKKDASANVVTMSNVSGPNTVSTQYQARNFKYDDVTSTWYNN